MKRADLTLTAGPNPVSARVAAALGSPIDYHYDPVFQEHFRDTERMVAEIYRDTDPRLHGAAGLSVFAHLEDLVERGVILTDGAPSLDGEFRLA